MADPQNLIYLHGLMGSSQGVKATLLRRLFPGILTPDFSGSLEERMASLGAILDTHTGWTIVGSSFGGLMGALYACRHPSHVHKLVLLAPALIWPDFASTPPAPIDIPTLIYHGTRDELVPLETVRELARRTFLNLEFYEVDDDHGLYETVHRLDWGALLAGGREGG